MVSQMGTREPTEIDLAIQARVQEVLQAVPEDLYTITLNWGDEAGMWFTEVRPVVEDAADFDIAFDGSDLINMNVGNTWYAMEYDESAVEEIGAVVEAVIFGRFQESGSKDNSFIRFNTELGSVGGGVLHVPIPWAWRRVRRFAPYASRST